MTTQGERSEPWDSNKRKNEKQTNMKHRNILTTILLLATLTVAAQNNYSPCYTDNMSKGNTAFCQGKYSEARTYYWLRIISVVHPTVNTSVSVDL